MKKIAIIGASDLGQLIAHHAPACGFAVAGFFDDFALKGTMKGNYPVLGALQDVEMAFRNQAFEMLMLGIGYNHMAFRKATFIKFSSHIPFAKLVHPSCYVDSSAVIGEGCFLLPGCTVDAHAVLGQNVLLNTACVIAHDTIVGSHTFCAPAVAVAGKTNIGECCIIGLNSTVIDNLTLCPFTRLAAGAVLTQNTEVAGMYAGVPAILKKKFDL